MGAGPDEPDPYDAGGPEDWEPPVRPGADPLPQVTDLTEPPTKASARHDPSKRAQRYVDLYESLTHRTLTERGVES